MVEAYFANRVVVDDPGSKMDDVVRSRNRGNPPMKITTRALWIALLLAAAPLAAHAQTLRVGLAEDLDVLDPTLTRSYVGRIVFAALCDKLFDIDEKLAIVPQLATGYEWSAEHLAAVAGRC